MGGKLKGTLDKYMIYLFVSNSTNSIENFRIKQYQTFS